MEQISIVQSIQEPWILLISFPAKCLKMLKEKWHHFRAKAWSVLRKFKMETEDDRNFASDFFSKTVKMIFFIMTRCSFAYLFCSSFKMVRL